MSGSASTITGAAIRAAVTGTSFGDNVLAVLPDVIGTTVGRLVGDGIASIGRGGSGDPSLALNDVSDLLRDDIVTGGGLAVKGRSVVGGGATVALQPDVTRTRGGSRSADTATVKSTSDGLATIGYAPNQPTTKEENGAQTRATEQSINSREDLSAEQKDAALVELHRRSSYWDMVLPAAAAVTGVLGISYKSGVLTLGGSNGFVVSDGAFRFGGANGIDITRGGITLGGSNGIVVRNDIFSVGGSNGIVVADSRFSVGGSAGIVATGNEFSIGGSLGIHVTQSSFSLAGYTIGSPAAAESTGPNLIPRLGPKGVNPLHHNANVLVRDAEGNVVAHQRFVSGNMTPEEQSLGFPRNTLASHTEARAVRSMELELGGRMTITGQSPPCPSCKGAMNRAASESGATIKYQWRQNGKTVTWTATPK